jgi:hypothetical protein
MEAAEHGCEPTTGKPFPKGYNQISLEYDTGFLNFFEPEVGLQAPPKRQ